MRVRLATLCSLAVVLAFAGCGFPTEGSPHAVEVEEQPPSSPSTTEGDVVRTEATTVWFVRDDRLVATTRQVVAPVDAPAVLQTLAAGASTDEASDGIRSAIPDPAMLVGAEVARGTATVALAAGFADIPAGDQVLALAQIVYTLTDLRGVGRVRFQIEGSPVVVPLPGGGSTEDSVSRDDFAALTPRS